MIVAVFLFALAFSGPLPTCVTRYDNLLLVLRTECSDGSIIRSRWNELLQRFDSVVIQQPRLSVRPRMPERPYRR